MKKEVTEYIVAVRDRVSLSDVVNEAFRGYVSEYGVSREYMGFMRSDVAYVGTIYADRGSSFERVFGLLDSYSEVTRAYYIGDMERSMRMELLMTSILGSVRELGDDSKRALIRYVDRDFVDRIRATISDSVEVGSREVSVISSKNEWYLGTRRVVISSSGLSDSVRFSDRYVSVMGDEPEDWDESMYEDVYVGDRKTCERLRDVFSGMEAYRELTRIGYGSYEDTLRKKQEIRDSLREEMGDDFYMIASYLE